MANKLLKFGLVTLVAMLGLAFDMPFYARFSNFDISYDET